MAVEAYQIAVEIALTGNAVGEADKLANSFRRLDDILQRVQRDVEELQTGMAGLDRVGSRAADSWVRAAAAMERAASAATRAGAAAAAGGPGRALVPYLPPPPDNGPGGRAGGLGYVYGGGGGEPPDEPFDDRRDRMPPLDPSGRGKGKDTGGLSIWNMFPAELVGALSGYAAFRSAGTSDVAERAALLSMGYKPDTPEFNAALKNLDRLSQHASQGTIFSKGDTAVAMPTAAAILGYGADTPEGRRKAFEEYTQIFRPALNFAESAKQMGLGSNLQDSVAAAVEFAHMTGNYNPATLIPALNELLNVAKLTHTTISRELRSMQYVVPAAGAAGMNLDEIVAITGYLQQRGLVSTTAGTAMGQLIAGLVPNSLQRLTSAHAREMRALGLTDDKGHLAKDVAPGGVISIEAVLKHLQDYEKTHTRTDVLAALRTVFNIRGERAAALLQDEDRIIRFLDSLARQPGATATQQALAESPYQQFEQMISRIEDIGNILATATLPALNVAFKHVTDAATAVGDYLEANPKVAAGTGLGAGALILWMLAKGGKAVWRGARSLAGLGGGAAAEGTEVAAGFPLGGLALTGGLTYLVGTAISAEIDKATKAVDDWLFGPGDYDKNQKFRANQWSKMKDELDKAWHWLIPSAGAAELPHPPPGHPNSIMWRGAAPGFDVHRNAVGPATPVPVVLIGRDNLVTVMPPTDGHGMPVHVTGGRLEAAGDVRVSNPGDIKHGVAAGLVHDSHGPQTGPTGNDIRLDPWAGAFQAAVP